MTHCNRCDCPEEWECFDTCHIDCGCCLHRLKPKLAYRLLPYLILGAFAFYGFYQAMQIFNAWFFP